MTDRTSDNTGWLFVAPALAVTVFCALVPLMVVVNYSVQDVFSGDQFLWAGAHWFQQILRSPDFYAALGRSLAFSALVLAIEVPLGVFIALSLAALSRRATVYVVLMSIPLLTPWLVVGFIWKVMVDSDIGWIGAALAQVRIDFRPDSPTAAWITIVAMDVWHWTSLIVLLCYAGLISIPEAYFRAARIDGASRWKIFRYIQLPKISRVLLIAIMLRLMDSLTVFVEPFMVTRGGPGTATTFLSLDLVQTATVQFDLGEAGALSIIYFLIILTLTWPLYKIMTQRAP